MNVSDEVSNAYKNETAAHDSRHNDGHYKRFTVPKSWVGQPLDPALIATAYELTPMQFTILKKVLRCGDAHKNRVQDLKDITSAAKRQLELEGLDDGRS